MPQPEGESMPYINIKVTGGAEAPTTEQKKELIRGVTDLVVRVLNKNPAETFVIIDEVPLENWGDGGITTVELREQQAKNTN